MKVAQINKSHKTNFLKTRPGGQIHKIGLYWITGLFYIWYTVLVSGQPDIRQMKQDIRLNCWIKLCEV